MSMKNEQGSMDVKQKNVLNAPLHKFSAETTSPSNLPFSLHAGMCTSSHPIASIITNSFLDLLASSGTDLRKAGVGPCQKLCIEALQWKSAVDKGISEVPEVKLECSHQKALESVDIGVLKRFAAGQEPRGDVVERMEGGRGMKGVRESKEIGGKEPKA